MSFSPHRLHTILQSGPSVRRYVVAYSGGCDSTALLHALSTLVTQWPECRIAALHVDHGWHRDSAQWAHHCQATAQEWGVPCHVLTMAGDASPGRNREATARVARYAAIEQYLEPGDMVLTAHHREDQAETVLLQMLRGAGPRGLAAMPLWLPLGAERWHGRPLLTMGRDALRQYAQHYDLTWLDDPSNFDTDLDRNYLRHSVWPALHERWPGLAGTLSRVAHLQSESAQLLDELGAQDIAAQQSAERDTLSVAQLNALQPARRRNVLRRWLAQCGLSMPSQTQLAAIENDVLLARWDATPTVTWPGACVRRYRDGLYATAPPTAHDPVWQAPWPMYLPLTLPSGLGALQVDHVHGRGLKTRVCRTENITVRFRRGGEQCRPVGSAHTRELKNLFQEWGVPPWERDRIPLLYVGEQLAHVVGRVYCAPFAAAPDEPGLDVLWMSVSAAEKNFSPS